MLGIAHNPSTRTVHKVALCLRVVALALLGALVLAASAQAATETPPGGVSLTEAPSTPLTPEAGAAGGGEPSGALGSSPAPEKITEAAKTPETVSIVAPEKTPVAPPATEAPVGNAPVAGTPAAPVNLPEVPTPPEKAPEPPKISAGTEKETLSVAAGPEKTSEDPPPPTIVDAPATLTRSDLGYATPEIGYEAAPDVPGALVNSPTNPPPTGGSLEAGGSEGAASVAAVAQISDAQRAVELSCELSSLSGGMSGGCSTE
jgi:hypothetical protein